MLETNGAAATTKTADEVAIVLPGREEVLKAFAGDILAAQPGVKVADDPAVLPGEGEKTKNDLSQTDLGQKTDQAVTAEPAWTEAQLAWFQQTEKATTAEEKAAAAKAQPAFSAEEVAWLSSQTDEPAKADAVPAVEDHLADEPELKGKLDAKTQERINGRIGKEVAKRKELAEKLAAAETQRADLERQLTERPASPGVQTGGPLETVNTVADVQATAGKATEALEQAEDLLAQLKRNPALVERTLRAAKVELKGEDGADDYSPAQMEDFLTGVKTNADRMLRRELPKRVEFLKQVDTFAAEATTLIPELKDPKSPQRQLANQLLTQFPGLKQMAMWPKAVALAILGMEVEKSRKAAADTAAKPRAKRPIPTIIPTPRGAAPSITQPKAKSNVVTDETVTAALDGDKNARLKVIQTLVPKF